MVPEIIDHILEKTMAQVKNLSNFDKIEVFNAIIERLETEKEDCMRTEYWNENEKEDRYE